jgi:16S rRNA processing protein RimM
MFVTMGEIVRAVGLRGEVKLLPEGDFLAEVLDSGYLRCRRGDDPPRRIQVSSLRAKGETLILKLEGVEGRDAAEAMVGEFLGFIAEDYDRPDFPRPEEPHPFLYHGLTVVTETGEEIGRVEGVKVLPANLVLEVRQEDREYLIPVIPPVVRSLDREAQRLVIHPLPGLLDEED